MSEHLAEYKNMSYNIKLYHNRVEIKHTIMPLVPPKQEVIPIKNISTVEIPFGKRLEIKTNDGKKHVLNLMPNQAKDFRKKILELL
jgi:hypothetical protein